MLKSMTAYGRASLQTRLGQITVEIQSVNRRFLEFNTALPQELSRFEIELKKWLTPHIARGYVTVKVTATFDGPPPFKIKPNLALAMQVKQAWVDIAQHLGLDKNAFNLSLLVKTPDLLCVEVDYEEEESYRQALKQATENALRGFLQMKIQEGDALQIDIMHRIVKLRQWIDIVEQRASFATIKYREKLLARLQEILPNQAIENEERILREIALFAEKLDIAEEITRFSLHLVRLEEMLKSIENIEIGKTLDFILQELGREINTISSKSSDAEISRCVIDIKSELERIREQIQNVE